MKLRSTPRRAATRIAHPKTTVRWRLTLLYGGLFLASGAALLAFTYTLAEKKTTTTRTPVRAIVQHAVSVKRAASLPTPNGNASINALIPRGLNYSGTRSPLEQAKPSTSLPRGATPNFTQVANGGPPSPKALKEFREFFSNGPGSKAIAFVVTQQRVSDLHQLIVESSIALAVMALISAALGWLVAGRVLRPLRTMTATTRQISETSLDRRLAMEGPRDELRQLADTIDGLLERLEAAFDAQRRFVANPSHELRTPLTAARAMLEMIISDPNATVDTFRDTCVQVLDESEQQEQLIDALLALAQGQRGIAHREAIDLAALVGEVVARHRPEADLRGLTLDASLEPALVSGDRRLIERLASNLVENAIRHNITSGHVGIRVAPDAGRASLEVVNTGLVVPEDQVQRLLQPFQRLAPERQGHREGLGLGLSIVAAIATAHSAELDVHAAAAGGLDVEVRFRRPLDGDLIGPDTAAPREIEPVGAARS
ncbi:MAG: sensor histidine kinase [Solirubrobacteraceae bacterium]